MANEQKVEPTTPVSILVAPGTGGDFAAEFYLTMLDWLLRDEMNLLGDLPEEISAWLTEALAKPVKLERHDIREQNEGAVQQELLREMFAYLADPQNKEEMEFKGLVEEIRREDLKGTLEALQRGDYSTAEKIRAELVERLFQRLAKRVTKESISALGSLAARGRAARVGALCMAIYRENPSALIERARGGDREAVIKLVKLDKLFFTDSCTAQVIRGAELRNDRYFLGQLASALRYKPKTNWRVGCRLYLYAMWILRVEMPSLTALWHRVDPDGNHFASFDAFERFVQRARKEFERMQAGPTTDFVKGERGSPSRKSDNPPAREK